VETLEREQDTTLSRIAEEHSPSKKRDLFTEPNGVRDNMARNRPNGGIKCWTARGQIRAVMG
jgi:hypothetical protein